MHFNDPQCVFIPDTIYTERYMMPPEDNYDAYMVSVTLACNLTVIISYTAAPSVTRKI